MPDSPLTAAEIALLQALNARDVERDLEITIEWSRQEFMRREYVAGRIGRGDCAPSLTKLRDLQHWIDWAGASSQRPPNVAG